jgi:hypothetical protein
MEVQARSAESAVLYNTPDIRGLPTSRINNQGFNLSSTIVSELLFSAAFVVD